MYRRVLGDVGQKSCALLPDVEIGKHILDFVRLRATEGNDQCVDLGSPHNMTLHKVTTHMKFLRRPIDRILHDAVHACRTGMSKHEHKMD
jgi:hypothetical protein